MARANVCTPATDFLCDHSSSRSDTRPLVHDLLIVTAAGSSKSRSKLTQSTLTPAKPKVKAVYPQHKVRGTTQHDRTLDGMFLPIIQPSSSKKATSAALTDSQLIAPRGVIDVDADGDQNMSNPAPERSEGSPGMDASKEGQRQPAASIRVVDSECFLQSVLDLREDVGKRRHGSTF